MKAGRPFPFSILLGLLVAVLLLWGMLLTLQAAMNDPAALKLARTMWGDQAMIGTARDIKQSNWTKLVGFRSVGCETEFTAVGTGFNTWDAAFANATENPYPISGPYRQTVTIQTTAWDDIAVTAVKFFIDGIAQPQLIPATVQPFFTASMPLDLAAEPDGLHVGCAQAFDGANNIGKSRAFLFRVDRLLGVPNALLTFPANKLRPVVNRLAIITP